MDVSTVIAIIGGIALLVGIFGGGVEAKEIKIPPIQVTFRIISFVIGAVLIVLAVLISKPEIIALILEPPSQPTSNATIVPTQILATLEPVPEGNLASTPTSFPTIEIQTSHAPVIESVDLREDTSSGALVIYQDIAFHDADGDAYYINYTLISTTATTVNITDGPIDVSTQQQQTGVTIFGTWICGEGNYEITLQAIILDRAGNQSNAMEYTMLCH